MPETLNLTVINKDSVEWDEAASQTLWVMHVIFEQGRGETGVPRCNVVVPGDEYCSLTSLIQMALAAFRILCVESMHDKDLMPGTDEDYSLHKTQGGIIKELSEIRFIRVDEHLFAANTTLVFKQPNKLLMRELGS
jgi:hypothetical protein